jgi:tetratricopeptide (TPR) repeat protein
MLRDEGHLKRDDADIWGLTAPLEKVYIPTKIHDVISRRLAKLQPEQNEILELASVIGEEFRSDVLGEVLESKRVPLLKQLAELENKHKLIRSMQVNFRFDNTKVREVLYFNIPHELRREYHKMVAESYERLYEDDKQDVLMPLTYHYHAANDPRTVNFADKAGDENRIQYANDEAIKHYEMAIQFLSEDNMEKRIVVMNKLANVCFVAGNWDKAVKYNHEVISASKKTKNQHAEAFGYYRLGEIYEKRSKHDLSLETLGCALDIFNEMEFMHAAIDVNITMGRVLRRKGKFDEAASVYLAAIDDAERIGENYLLGKLYDEIGIVYDQKGDHEKAEKSYQKSVSLLAQSENLFELGRTYNNLGVMYDRKNDLVKALEFFEKYIEIAEKIGDLRGMGFGFSNAAEMLAKFGENEMLEKAEKYCKKALNIFEKIGDRYMIGAAHKEFGITYTKMKKWDDAIVHFEKAINATKEAELPYYLAETHFFYGEMYREKGDNDEAIKHIRTAKDIWEEIGSNKRVEEASSILKEIS